MQIILILIILLIVWLIIIHFFRLPKDSTLIGYCGTNGGGKTFNMTSDAIRFIRKSRRHWKKANRKILPSKKYAYYKGKNKPCIYSNYPILINTSLFSKKRKYKEISLDITNDIMFLEKSIPQGSIVVIDEFSSWISQFEYNETFSTALNDYIQKFRHYLGNDSHLLVCDQASGNIPLQVRRRLNKVMCCLKTKHYFKFIHITSYKTIDLTDDVKSVEVINDSPDSDDNILKMFRIQFVRRYDDRAFSNRYYFVDKNELNYSFIYSPMKVLLNLEKPLKKKKYRDLDYDIKQEIKIKEESENPKI